MSNAAAEVAGGVVKPELEPGVADFQPTKLDKLVIYTALKLGRVLFHPEVHFEDEAAIREHRDNKGVFHILMTHFNRLEPGFLLPLVDKHESVEHLRYTTSVTARAELWGIPGLARLLRGINAIPVKRATERPNETRAERDARQESNEEKQAIAGRYMAHGYNSIIWPEGTSKQTVLVDGEPKRVKRDNKTLATVRRGFVYSHKAMTPEELKNVRLLVIASHFGGRLLGILRPTIYVGSPTVPLAGTIEEIRSQGEALMRQAVAEAIRLDRLRWGPHLDELASMLVTPERFSLQETTQAS